MSVTDIKRIALVGAGRIGSAFAYYLERAGHDLTVIARPGSDRLAQLQRDQGVMLKSGERAEMRVLDALDEETPYDVVLVTVLDQQVDAILPALKRSKARCIHFMFVTFEPERLRDAIGADRATFGMPFIQATFDGDGRLSPNIGPQKTLHGDRRWVELFEGAGIRSAFEPEMLLWLRSHTPLAAAFESVCFAGERRKAGASWAEAMTSARGVQGGLELVKALGKQVYPGMKERIRTLPTFVVASILWALTRITSFRTLLASGVGEARALVDVMAASKVDAPDAVKAVKAMRPPA